nr:PREDICTED: uncharacterized protein LOC109034194 [Bemisia tabaci]
MLLMNDGYNPEGKGNRKFNRFLLTLWGIFTLNIVSAYSGSLAARLTLPEFEPMIHTPEGLSEKNYLFSAYYLSSWLGYMTQRYKLKLRLINTTEWEPEDGRQTAFFTKRVGDKYFMEVEQLPLALLKDMRASKVCIEQYFMTFALPRGSGLGRFLNPIIRRLVEAGITTHWLNRVFESQYTLFPFEQAHEYRDRQAVQVKLSFFYLQSAFLLWFVGHALAAIAFLAETTKHWRQETRIRRLLRPDREPGFKFSMTK